VSGFSRTIRQYVVSGFSRTIRQYVVSVVAAGFEKPSVSAFQAAAPQAATMPGRLIVFGDVTLFLGKPGLPGNCALQSRFKKGDPVGFRMTAYDSETGKREPSAQFVVHLSYGGTTGRCAGRHRALQRDGHRQVRPHG
jgi:hypothetical protein